MKDNELGLSATTTNTAPKLKVWRKNGGWFDEWNRGYKTAWIGVEDTQPSPDWPQAFTAVLVTNSRLGNDFEDAHPSQAFHPEDVLLAAFESGL